MQQVNGYDFKGNPLSTQVQLLDDPELTDVDWTAGAEPDLSTEIFSSSITYDALNRPVTSTDPGGNIQAYTYDKGGMLKAVMLNSVSYVNDIHYDAKGQRQAIWYGNSTKTSYTYDPETFRLRRLLTVNLSNNDILQDLHYWYDPVGNITEIQDDAQQTLFFNNSVVAPTQEFTYDALYRLIAAEGRELIGSNSFGANDNYNDASWQTSHKGDGNAVQRYTQQYTYDAVGNILELSHNAAAGAYTRTYAIATDSNRLLSTTVGRTSPPGSNTYAYAYDVRGNMETMPHLSSMGWNLNNELSSIAKGTMAAWYQYSGGQRVRKYVDKGSFKEERIYLGSFEIYRKFDHTSSLIIERTTVHVSDDTGRIAMLETRTEGDAVDDNGTAGLLTRYIYSNHLQSASLELDGTGAIISYEEYHPYGTTSYQAMNATIHAVAKRYRYTGKERDEESGLYYHGARYYIPWLCRWSAVDPLESDYAGMSPYNYSFNNPVVWNDLSGMEPDKEQFANGYTVKTVLLDINGKPMPEGTKLPYSQEHTNTLLKEHKKNLDKGEVEAGTQVVEEAKGEGGMYTTTVTYRVVREATEDQPALVRLWGYQANYERYSKPEPQEPEKDLSFDTFIEPAPDPVRAYVSTPPVSITKPLPKPKPKPKQSVPKVLPPPPPSITLSTSDIVGTAVWRTDMTQQGYEYTLNLVRQLRNTDLGAIQITFGVPDNLGDVVRSGFENVNPVTGRVTSYDPMIMRPFTNSNMQMRNVEAQGRDLQNQLQRRLNVPVQLQYRYNSGITTIRFIPRNRQGQN